MGMFATSTAGVSAYARGVRIEDDTKVNPTMVMDWLAGFEAYVRIRIGDLAVIEDIHESLVDTAIRRIIEMHVAGDVLDAAYQEGVGREEGRPGDPLRKQAMTELVDVVANIEKLRQAGLNNLPTTGSGGVSMSAPVARIKDGMVF